MIGALKIPTAQKVRVQGMHQPAGHGARGGVEGLAQNLAPEHLSATYIAAFAAKQVDLENLEFKQAKKISDSPIHKLMGPLAP